MYVDYGADTHVGMVREKNEDSLLMWIEEGLFLVADGMGGHGNGEIASQECVEAIQEYYTRPQTPDPSPLDDETVLALRADKLTRALRHANHRILDLIQRRPSLAGMGTTVVAAHVGGPKVLVAHAGDSRCYLLRNGDLFMLTEDHSLVNEVEGMGRLTTEMAVKLEDYQHVLVNAIGVHPSDKCRVDVTSFEPEVGDRLLLCSDGLTNEIGDQEIRDVLDSPLRSRDLGAQLVARANEEGGKDNVTVLVLTWLAEKPEDTADDFGDTEDFMPTMD